MCLLRGTSSIFKSPLFCKEGKPDFVLNREFVPLKQKQPSKYNKVNFSIYVFILILLSSKGQEERRL